jgi:hypothetical protein
VTSLGDVENKMTETKGNLLSFGMLRGTLGMVLGTLVGMGIVSLIRLVMGLPAWNAEPAWVVGALVGTIFF